MNDLNGIANPVGNQLSLLSGDELEKLLTSVGEGLGDRLAIQVKLADGKVLVNNQFKRYFPGIVERGGIDQVWSSLSPQEKHISGYGETGYVHRLAMSSTSFV